MLDSDLGVGEDRAFLDGVRKLVVKVDLALCGAERIVEGLTGRELDAHFNLK